jgi:RNase H-fold protein (predicted Holliday junction resolvase)
MAQAVIGIDPGSAKAGYALVAADGQVLQAGIEPVATLAQRLGAIVREYPVAWLAIGKGSRSSDVADSLRVLGIPLTFVDEYETSRRARELYFSDHPPRGWRRFIPLGLQLPSRPIDDYAAILIARNFLASGRGSAFTN